MHYLPAVELPGGGRLRLPLSDASAGELAGCWLAPAPDALLRAARLLGAEPVLLVWTYLAHAPLASRRSAPIDALRLADWLATRAMQRWTSEPVASAELISTTRRERWTELSSRQAAKRGRGEAWPSGEQLIQWAEAWRDELAMPEPVPAPAQPLNGPNDSEAEAVRARWQASSTLVFDWLDRLAERLRRLEQLEQRFAEAVRDEKLRALKEFAYGASHELNNPLANISTRAQTLLMDEQDPERRRKLATINNQAYRAHEMISDLMLFAHPPAIEYTAVRVADLLHQAVSEMLPLAEAQATTIRVCEIDEGLSLMADERHLVVTLRALVQNSLEAVGSQGYIELIARRVEQSDATALAAVEIRIRDDGPGIPDDMRSRIFDPYFSGREAGRGLGLGLSKAWRIVMLHGGRLSVAEQAPGVRGAEFVIELPVEKPA